MLDFTVLPEAAAQEAGCDREYYMYVYTFRITLKPRFQGTTRSAAKAG